MADAKQQSDAWLNPSAALNRFDLPQQTLTALAPQARQRVRYGFHIGNLGLLIDADTVSEVLEQTAIYPIPHTPGWLAGLINLRGNLVPVFDLKRLFELEHRRKAKRHLLVLDRGETTVAILIDNLPQATDLSHKLSRLPPLPDVLQPHVASAYAHNNSVWLELDHRSLFESLRSKIKTTA